eukprot:11202405-Lingulodinium_polyedra.AAC.1
MKIATRMDTCSYKYFHPWQTPARMCSTPLHHCATATTTVSICWNCVEVLEESPRSPSAEDLYQEAILTSPQIVT